ncbi:MAG: biopolymer transporter ExbD [Bradymonadales bacterium]|nr:biopolymer transporter ExbD [Bradymonadales bacterium]
MGMTLKGSRDAISDINVTPLVDVMLVLLIIFMITATLIRDVGERERRSQLHLPVTTDFPNIIDITDTSKMILRIDENLRIFLGDTLVVDCSAVLSASARDRFIPCFQEIALKLGQNPILMRDREIYIMGDRTIPYGFVVGTLARLQAAGVDRVGMIAHPDYLPESTAPLELLEPVQPSVEPSGPTP